MKLCVCKLICLLLLHSTRSEVCAFVSQKSCSEYEVCHNDAKTTRQTLIDLSQESLGRCSTLILMVPFDYWPVWIFSAGFTRGEVSETGARRRLAGWWQSVKWTTALSQGRNPGDCKRKQWWTIDVQEKEKNVMSKPRVLQKVTRDKSSGAFKLWPQAAEHLILEEQIVAEKNTFLHLPPFQQNRQSRWLHDSHQQSDKLSLLKPMSHKTINIHSGTWKKSVNLKV